MSAADSKYSGGAWPGWAVSRLNTLSPNAADVPSATNRSMLPDKSRAAFHPAT